MMKQKLLQLALGLFACSFIFPVHAEPRLPAADTALAAKSTDSLSAFLNDSLHSRESGEDALQNLINKQTGKNTLVDGVTSLDNSLGARASRLVDASLSFLGTPYRFGGNDESGLDCSGFVRAVYSKTLGKMLPRRAAEQAASTQTIAKEDLQPGDLVFFNTMQRTFSHVGIYIGNNQFVHAPRAGGVVRVENMGMSYWQTRFNGARRVDTTQTAAN